MSRVVVTGGAGFIGSNLVDLLIEYGHKVTVIDDFSTGKAENLGNVHLHKNFDVIEGRIQDPETWKRVSNKTEFVFHLAALARIQPSITDPVSSNDANLTGTLQVLEFCRRTKAKLIFSGSSSIYEGITFPTREDDPKRPKSPYAMQKLMCEQYIRLYRELYGLEYAVLRYFNVYGERQILDGAYAAVVGILLDAKLGGNELPITNDGEQMRDFTYVKDVARANMLAMDWQGTFNIGTGNSYSINQLADRMGGSKRYIGDRRGEARMTKADNTKARNAGAKGGARWLPTVDIMDWIDENNR